MTTATCASEKLLVYDGDCPMCLATVGLLLRWGLVRGEQARANHDLAPEDLETAKAAGIRNQLVVLDPHTRQTRAGSDGLLWIIGENLKQPWWLRALQLPGLRQLVRFGYETISYNRRIISPPRTRIVCDCEPEVTLARRLSLIVPAVLIAIFFTALFGAAVFYGWNLGSAAAGAGFMLAAAGSGWIVLGLVALKLLRGEQRIDYLAHLSVTAMMGVLVLAPGSVLMPWLPRAAAIGVAVLSVGISFTLMLLMQRKRVAAIGLSRRWLVAWAMTLIVAMSTASGGYFWR